MKILTNYDFNQNQLVNAVIQKLATPPANPVSGQLYFDTAKKRLFTYNGTEWIGADALGAAMTGESIVNAINDSASLIDDDNLSQAVRDAIQKAHNTHSISDVTGLQNALDGKVDNSRVLTDVPANAEFTDTVTSINGKTGVIKKEDITALGIPAQDTVYTHPTTDGYKHVPATGTTNNGKVLKAGPTPGSLSWEDDNDTKYTAGAGLTLTGTVFTPTFGTTAGTVAEGNDARFSDARTPKAHIHPITEITGLDTILDEKVDNDRVLTDVPANAVFTDTVTTVNGKTGAITKADIVALGIPSSDTTYSVFSTTTDGLVPKTTTSNTTDYLRRDGTWASPPDTKYTLPVASSTVLGGVKSGTDITIDENGNVSVNDNSHEHTIENVEGLQSALDSKETPSGASAKASIAEDNAKEYTDTKIAELVGSAPETLDTLYEIAEALGEDPNFATTILDRLAEKTKKYVTSVGDGTLTSIVITHNLNTRDAVVQLRETASPYSMVITDVEFTTENTITLKFAKAPTLNEYTVTIIG